MMFDMMDVVYVLFGMLFISLVWWCDDGKTIGPHGPGHWAVTTLCAIVVALLIAWVHWNNEIPLGKTTGMSSSYEEIMDTLHRLDDPAVVIAARDAIKDAMEDDKITFREARSILQIIESAKHARATEQTKQAIGVTLDVEAHMPIRP